MATTAQSEPVATSANLHLHSRYSDGSLTPEEIAASALHEKLSVAALTDHDSMGGTARFAAACAGYGIRSIPACEIDVVDPLLDYKSEILAYFPGADPTTGTPHTRALLARILDARRARIDFLLAAARSHFGRPDLTVEDLEREKLAAVQGNHDEAVDVAQLSWSKVDFYEYLRQRGALYDSTSYRTFRKDWLDSGRLPVRRIDKPTVNEVSAIIRADGGYPVLPHPGHIWDDEPGDMRYGKPKLSALLREFRLSGVEGIELYWYGNAKKTVKINKIVMEAAAPFGYFFTYGSDCHGPGSGKDTIALFSGDFAGFPSDGHSGPAPAQAS